ncbi:MAG TPA: M48 family metalloprotease [Solirubrobacteraceae bacterium]
MKAVRGAGIFAPLTLAAIGAEAAVRLLTPREPLPTPAAVDIRDHFSDAEIARGRRFARPQLAIGLARSALDAAVLALVVHRRARRGLPAGAGGVGSGDGSGVATLAGAAAAGAALSSVLTLPGLPLSALARHRALRVGLATQSWRDWGSDLAKATAIQGALAAAGAAAVTGAARRWPRGWWLPAAAGSVAFGAAFAALAPVVLDPIFNDFTPLPDGDTRGDVLALADAAGVSVGEVFSVDASRRTTAANAYVTGLGPTKRVVLYDTLLERFNRDEVRVVVAHELAHVRHRDVARSVAFAALTAPAAAFAVQRLSWAMSPVRASAGALPALALATGAVSLPLAVLSSRLSRAVERRADDFSLRLSQAPRAFVSFERAIALQNIADLEPPRLLTKLLASHPPTAERIGAALAHERG